jgi:glycosyltransferase involved in cell wall biosynthesis
MTSTMRGQVRPISLAIYLPDLSGGGAERLHVNLAPQFVRAGYRVTFLLDRLEGSLLSQLPQGCAVHALGADRQIRALPKLVRYLKRARPDVLVANMEHMNVMAVLARALARVPTRIIAIQHCALSEQVRRPSLKFRVLPLLFRLVLPFADNIVAVSIGVADDLAEIAGLSRSKITVIYNGVVGSDFEGRLACEPEHPWFAQDWPIILGIGRFVAQKDFTTLIRAFGHVAEVSDARLIILGEGPMRAELQEHVRSLKSLSDRISMPGFLADPLPLLGRARLFVLSSRFEGFGNVVAEALACGTPVVSTDCPHGPAEILDRGRYGALVPVGNAEALGSAILEALNRDPDRMALIRRGQMFSVLRCAREYGRLIEDCKARASSCGQIREQAQV